METDIVQESHNLTKHDSAELKIYSNIGHSRGHELKINSNIGHSSDTTNSCLIFLHSLQQNFPPILPHGQASSQLPQSAQFPCPLKTTIPYIPFHSP